MSDIHAKTSGQIAREVEAQRTRVEATIGEIQQRLSPGQLVDELLNYTKNGAGGEFVANLGRSVSTNPLPVALMGISLVWLMAKQGAPAASSAADLPQVGAASSGAGYESGSRPAYRYATVTGDLRLVGRSTAEDGRSYSEFTDDSGRKYRALTGASGQRSGDFLDETGASYRGFKNAAGDRVQSIRDQAGDLIDSASDWLSDLWDGASEGVGKAASALAEGKDAAQSGVSTAAGKIGHQARQSGTTLMGTLHDQPLVGGALAFAVGAAIAASLPHTEKEDEAFGEAADALRGKAGDLVGEVYAEGKEQVAETVEQVSERAGEIYQQARSGSAAREAQSAPAPSG